MKKIILMSLLIATNCNAGLNRLTHHSRANCIANESISWDAKAYHYLKIDAGHIDFENSQWHTMLKHDDERELTWRYALVHWVEGTTGNWQVNGFHSVYNYKGCFTMYSTEAKDCNIYAGWWAVKPEDEPSPDSVANDGCVNLQCKLERK